jgi:hypothetical protein
LQEIEICVGDWYIVQLILYSIRWSLSLPRLLGVCRLVLLRRFDDSLEVFRPLSPSERRRILAVLLQVAEQKILQVFLGALDAVGQCLLGENVEKAFDHVHPGGVRCREVEMQAGMWQQPLLGGFILVDVQVVQGVATDFTQTPFMLAFKVQTKKTFFLRGKHPTWKRAQLRPYEWNANSIDCSLIGLSRSAIRM